VQKVNPDAAFLASSSTGAGGAVIQDEKGCLGSGIKKIYTHGGCTDCRGNGSQRWASPSCFKRLWSRANPAVARVGLQPPIAGNPIELLLSPSNNLWSWMKNKRRKRGRRKKRKRKKRGRRRRMGRWAPLPPILDSPLVVIVSSWKWIIYPPTNEHGPTKHDRKVVARNQRTWYEFRCF
jgi:hypothetical protein